MNNKGTLYVGSVNNGVATIVTPITAAVIETLHDLVARGVVKWEQVHREFDLAPRMGIATFSDAGHEGVTGTKADMAHILASAAEEGYVIGPLNPGNTVPQSNQITGEAPSPTIEEFCSHIGITVPTAILATAG